jgi:oxygen-independent coproporphyrinogen-3 oxidase
MDSISRLLTAPVPRYTSYPTAPHFHAGIKATEYCEWLEALPADKPLSLYFHIPFCDTLCWFCGCHMSVVNGYAPVREYRALLLEEIELVAAALRKRHAISHIHWGGGSPTILSSDDIARLNKRTRSRFDVLPEVDFAVEIDPRGLSPDTVLALKAAGVTRASLGLQDCDPMVQRAINRVQSIEETACAVSMLRDAGIASLNLDLIYGLPHQTLASWERTLDFALSLSPDRLAVFGYAHVPQFKKHQALIRQETLPDIDLRFHLAELARQVLCAHGYVAIGLDHFAKSHDPLARAAASGTVSRNFQGYTTDSAPSLIGMGASAIGSMPQGYVQNVTGVPAYRDAINAGELPVARGVALQGEDRMRRDIIERLMCDLRVDLNAIAAGYHLTPEVFSASLEEISPLVKRGVVEICDGTIIVSPAWRSAVRLVCAAFDQYLPRQTARHSMAV